MNRAHSLGYVALYAIHTHCTQTLNLPTPLPGVPCTRAGSLCLAALGGFLLHDHVYMGVGKRAEGRGQSGGSMDVPKGA